MHLIISIFLGIALINSAVTYNVIFTLSAKNLPRSDPASGLPDAWVIVYIRDGNVEKIVGRTEDILDSVTPKWKKEFEIPYNDYEDKELRFTVWDTDVIGHDYLGDTLPVTVAELVDIYKTTGQGTPYRKFDMNIKSKRGCCPALYIEFKVEGADKRSAGNHSALPYCTLIVLSFFLLAKDLNVSSFITAAAQNRRANSNF